MQPVEARSCAQVPCELGLQTNDDSQDSGSQICLGLEWCSSVRQKDVYTNNAMGSPAFENNFIVKLRELSQMSVISSHWMRRHIRSITENTEGCPRRPPPVATIKVRRCYISRHSHIVHRLKLKALVCDRPTTKQKPTQTCVHSTFLLPRGCRSLLTTTRPRSKAVCERPQCPTHSVLRFLPNLQLKVARMATHSVTQEPLRFIFRSPTLLSEVECHVHSRVQPHYRTSSVAKVQTFPMMMRRKSCP